MSQTRYLQNYREQQIQTADRGTILVMLYQGAIDFVRRAVSAKEKGDIAEKGMCILKAHAIISELHATLDLETGGELAGTLESLYIYMLDRITIANFNNDPKPLHEIISLLTTLKEGWVGAVAPERKRVEEASP
jgi:flagellar protein FliS